MGRPKLLLPLGGGTLVEHVLAAWRASRVAATIVVVHPDDATLADVCRRAGAEVVVPATPPADMKASIMHGLDRVASAHAPTDRDAWLMAPADMPGINAALIDTVIGAYDSAAPRVVVAKVAGKRGHPVLFPWLLAGEVSQLRIDEGVNALLARQPPVEISWDDAGALVDIDSPTDYRRLQDEYKPT